MTRVWTPQMDEQLHREYPTAADPQELAVGLGVSLSALRSRARRLGVCRRLAWSDHEVAFLRHHYSQQSAGQLASQLGRTAKAVHSMAVALGLQKQPRAVTDARWLERLRQLNAEGYCDSAIAAEMGCERHTVSQHRQRLGLPSHSRGERYRSAVRQATQRQLAQAELASLAEVRVRAFAQYAARNGWPADLRPRAVQILNLLASVGMPLTRRQIAEGIGLPWIGSRRSLKSRDPEGSYLAHLIRRDLVLRLPKLHTVQGQGKGRSCDLYCLGPAALAILATLAMEECEEEST